MADKSAHINTSNFPDALESIKTMAKEMEEIVDNLNGYKENLLKNWVGKGRNQFERTYKVMLRKLEDGRDVTWDMYEDLISAQEELIQTDVDIATQRNTVITNLVKKNYFMSQVDKYIYKYDVNKNEGYILGDLGKKSTKVWNIVTAD